MDNIGATLMLSVLIAGIVATVAAIVGLVVFGWIIH